MTDDQRIQLLEEQIEETKDELKEILLDIRSVVMEATSPIPNDLDREDLT